MRKANVTKAGMLVIGALACTERQALANNLNLSGNATSPHKFY